MILHVTFTSGANPIVYYGTTERLQKAWMRISKADNTARCDFFKSRENTLHCRAVHGGGYVVGRYFDGAHKSKYYTRLAWALKAVDKGDI